MSFGLAFLFPNTRRSARVVQKTLEACWKKWQTVPDRIRYSVYVGPLLGIAFYPILGFCVAGVVKGSIAAAIQSCIGNVAAGSLFATMQSLGAKGILMWLMALGGLVITPAVVEIIVWIYGSLLQLLRWLSSSLGAAIPTGMTEGIEKFQNLICSRAKVAGYRSTDFPFLTL